MPMNDVGSHPSTHIDFECEFAAAQIAALRPSNLLDIGSYRQFVVGLAAGYAVTSLDVRERAPSLPRETVLTGDAKRLPLADASVECIVSLCAIEHFGLGRYGDPFDIDADRTAAAEMRRVLRPGGKLILSTTITSGPAVLAFNAHRIYTYDMVHELTSGLRVVEERFFSHKGGVCDRSSVSDVLGVWDVYCGCFQKGDA